MALSDLTGFLDDDALQLPGVPSRAHPAGRTYRVPSPDFDTGLRLTAMVNLGMKAASGETITDAEKASLAFSDEQEAQDFLPMVLGSAFDEMRADGVSWVRVQRLGQYATLYFAVGKDGADEMVRRSAEGNPPAANRATRRAASPRGSSGTATSTRSRASTAGTTSRRRSSGKPKAT